MTTDPRDRAEAYFDAWNRHDSDDIVAQFSEGGTYSDPATEEELTGRAIGAYAQQLFEAFPDLEFNVERFDVVDDSTVSFQWTMRGTNTGSFQGAPPTGRTIALPGADFLTINQGGIRSVRGYFDQRTFVEQLGFEVLVQPATAGPFSFGNSVSVGTGKDTTPGAFSLTRISVRSENEGEEVREYARQIMQEMMEMPGFLSAVNSRAGKRMYTVTAWEDSESPRRMMHRGTHREAMTRFFGPDFAAGGVTSVWTPERINTVWVRCPACDHMADSVRPDRTCGECGEPLPEPDAFW